MGLLERGTDPTYTVQYKNNKFIYLQHLNPHCHSSSGKSEHPSKRFSWWWPCRYTVSWDVVPCSVSKIDISGEPTMYIYPNNRYTEFLQNVCTSLPRYMVSQPPKLYSSHSMRLTETYIYEGPSSRKPMDIALMQLSLCRSQFCLYKQLKHTHIHPHVSLGAASHTLLIHTYNTYNTP